MVLIPGKVAAEIASSAAFLYAVSVYSFIHPKIKYYVNLGEGSDGSKHSIRLSVQKETNGIHSSHFLGYGAKV